MKAHILRSGRWLMLAAAVSGLSACVVVPPRTQVVYKPAPVAAAPHWNPAEHPYYGHAMSDLRQARALLARPDAQPVQDDERWAVGAIDAALNEMKQAAIEDGKNPWQIPAPDARLSPTDRFHQALQLLDQAKRDASHREDDPWVRDLQGRILHHIDDAHRATQQAIADALR
ncbi:hypothetical protein [Aquitalea magnusonii]|uniref:Lipoprotein n=1 Tax=Aquitalea magnusonii TaxID=332411 RepID=A0A318JJ95_9NEIS|nr:hypothetical protein [Aquitalea magnusonii]PXX47962.1 hypothetical protein DFR38_10848 [Aquitalea magnusonii]